MIKLNAGLSRKVGQPNFSSLGASVNLELELESSLVSDPDKMHDKIRSLFTLARKAVDEELKNGHPESTPATKPQQPKPQDNTICSECGTDNLSEKVVKYSTDRFGRVLCYRCQKSHNGNEGR